MRSRLVVGLSVGMVVTLGSWPAGAQRLRRPVACEACIGAWFYVDHEASAGARDYTCGASTYEGHAGTDFALIGNNDAIGRGEAVVAAADGVVIVVEDGHFDRCTGCDAAECRGAGGGLGNHVVVEHAAHRTVYGHLRRGSVRVAVGARVRCGDVIGEIGSSGCSTAAHVHFEVRALDGSVLDPFAGACSASSGLWVEQGAYRGMPAARCDGEAPADAGASGEDAHVPADGSPTAQPMLDAPTIDASDLGGDAMSTDATGEPAHDASSSRSADENPSSCSAGGTAAIPPAIAILGLVRRRGRRSPRS